MGILAPTAGERFLIRTFKYWEGNYDREWVNNYFIIAMVDATQAGLSSSAEAIMNFERNLMDTRVTTARTVISTYLPDSDPYDGNEFYTIPYEGNGIRTPGLLGDILPLTDVRFVRFAPALGRTSFLGYRASIYEGEVNAASGRREFDDVVVQNALIAGLVDSHLSYILPGGDGVFQLCSGSTSPRPIISVASGRPGYLPMKHKYYNVGSPPTP